MIADPKLIARAEAFIANGTHDAGARDGLPEPWGTPTPLNDVNRAPFPVGALEPFGGFADFVSALSEFAQTPVDLPAVVALGTVSAAVGGKFEVEVEPGYCEPTNLYLLTLLQSGARKSAVFRETTAPVLAWERERNPEERKIRSVWESRRRVDEAKLKELEATLANPTRSRGKDAPPVNTGNLVLQADDLARHLAENRPPRLTRVVADDVTAERLAGLLAEQDGAVAVMSAEGGFFGNIGGRYSSMPFLDTMLKAHAGDDIRVDRQGRIGETVPRPALTICISAQPQLAQELGSIPGFRGKGAAARFLVSMPESNLGQRRVGVEPMPGGATTAWAQAITRLLDIVPMARDADDGSPIPHRLRLSPEAHREHLRYREEIERALAPDGSLAEITDWASKLPGAAARIAGLLHVFATPEGEAAQDRAISQETMTASIEIAKYFTSHARLFFDALAGDDGGVTAAARTVLDQLCSMAVDAGGGAFTVSRRDLHERLRCRKQFKKIAALDAPLERLAEHGFVQITVEPTGGRPSKVVHLNPHAQKPQNPQKRIKP